MLVLCNYNSLYQGYCDIIKSTFGAPSVTVVNVLQTYMCHCWLKQNQEMLQAIRHQGFNRVPNCNT